MESVSEISYFFSKLGLSFPFEKYEFSKLYNYIFITPPPPPHHNYPTNASTTVEPAIVSFQTVFRKFYRKSYYIDMSTVLPEARGEFEKCLNGNLALGSQENLKTSLRSEMETQSVWIHEVNEWRRDGFQKAAREDGERSFKNQLWEEYGVVLDKLITYFEDDKIREFAAELAAKIVKAFLAKFPSFEEKSHQLAKWTEDLGNAFDRQLNRILEKNNKTRKYLEKVLRSMAVTKYKQGMSDFLAKHPLVGKQRLELCHNKEKNEVEMWYYDYARGESPKHFPAWKSASDAKINQEFRILEGRRKAERDGKIGEFLKGVRADAGKRYREIFKSSMEPAKAAALLDKLTSQQVYDALDRDLDKAAEELLGSMGEGLNLSTQKAGPSCSSKRSSGGSSGGGAGKRVKM